MIVQLTPSYYVHFEIEGTWHRYPCKLDKEGTDNLIKKLNEKRIATRTEEISNEIAMLVAVQ